MQNKRIVIIVRPQRSRTRAGRMHNHLSSFFVHNGVVNCRIEVSQRGHYGDEIGGIFFVVEGERKGYSECSRVLDRTLLTRVSRCFSLRWLTGAVEESVARDIMVVAL